jgi:excinuclease UvrABC nuclease subunit
VLALDCGLEFDPARDEEFFAALPPRPAVVLIEPWHAGAQAYLLRTADLRRRLERLLRPAEGHSQRLNLREFAARVRFRLTGSPFEQSLVHYQHARELFPGRYRALARLRPPALLKVNLSNEYPRCYVTRRIRVDPDTGCFADRGFYFGPFASRKSAEAFANEFLNLFKMRRCQIKIRRDPAFPGCIYSEMKMCLAPCFAGCTKEEYDVEVGRVARFLASSGASLVGEFERERDAASEALDFERAAAWHRKLDKVAEILRGLPELARKLDELDAVILQRAVEENAVALFAVRGGMIADPFDLRFGELAGQPRSVEEILREQLGREFGSAQGSAATFAHAQAGRGEFLSDYLALLARWYFGRPREGEIFFPQRVGGASQASAKPEWPYRRIIRACSRLLTPQVSLPLGNEPGREPGPHPA